MARDLATTLTELDSAIKAENSAWAASRGHAENAHRELDGVGGRAREGTFEGLCIGYV